MSIHGFDWASFLFGLLTGAILLFLALCILVSVQNHHKKAPERDVFVEAVMTGAMTINEARQARQVMASVQGEDVSWDSLGPQAQATLRKYYPDINWPPHKEN